MLKKSVRAALFFAMLAFVASCNSGDSKTFSNKTDSLAFAQAVMDQYPEARSTRMVSDTSTPASSKPGDSFSPISWQTVEDFSKRYDESPGLKSPQGFYYQGYSIDTAGYNRLMKTTSIKGLYLRLGKKPDGDYTIMILGTDANGKIINTEATAASPRDTTNFDNIPPCPDLCP